MKNSYQKNTFTVSHDTKEKMFHLWDELNYLLKKLSKKYPNQIFLKELFKLQLKSKLAKEIYHHRKFNQAIDVITLENLLDGSLEKSVILKWEELVIESFNYLQEARMQGGTAGHKVGPICSFQEKTKKQYQGEILQLKYFIRDH